MKIALYIEDGLEQIVLTPETDTEDNILKKVHDKGRDLQIKRGGFYNCQGGWIRHSSFPNHEIRDDESTILVLTTPTHTNKEDE